MRRALFVTIAVAIIGTALTLVTPALAGGGGCHGEETEANASVVELRHSCFTATVTHVDPGTQVAFENRDPFTHNVIGFGAIWGDIEGFDGGETRRFTFRETGVFPYACTLHPGMVGAVVVGGDETLAGDAGTVVAANSTGSGGPDASTSTGAQQTDNRLSEVALALAALVLGAGLLLRRRESPRV